MVLGGGPEGWFLVDDSGARIAKAVSNSTDGARETGPHTAPSGPLWQVCCRCGSRVSSRPRIGARGAVPLGPGRAVGLIRQTDGESGDDGGKPERQGNGLVTHKACPKCGPKCRFSRNLALTAMWGFGRGSSGADLCRATFHNTTFSDGSLSCGSNSQFTGSVGVRALGKKIGGPLRAEPPSKLNYRNLRGHSGQKSHHRSLVAQWMWMRTHGTPFGCYSPR